VSYSLVHDGTKQNCFNQHLHASISSRQEISATIKVKTRNFLRIQKNKQKNLGWFSIFFIVNKQPYKFLFLMRGLFCLAHSLLQPIQKNSTARTTLTVQAVQQLTVFIVLLIN